MIKWDNDEWTASTSNLVSCSSHCSSSSSLGQQAGLESSKSCHESPMLSFIVSWMLKKQYFKLKGYVRLKNSLNIFIILSGRNGILRIKTGITWTWNNKIGNNSNILLFSLCLIIYQLWKRWCQRVSHKEVCQTSSIIISQAETWAQRCVDELLCMCRTAISKWVTSLSVLLVASLGIAS